MDRRSAIQTTCAAGIGLLGGCASRPSYEVRMASLCKSSTSILFLADDPRQVVIGRGQPGFPDVIRPTDGTITFYQWVAFTFLNLTEVCQISPLDYLEATRRLGIDVGTFGARGRPVVQQAMEFDHVGYDPRTREATLRAAAAAGARYLVVGQWKGASSDVYDLVQMTRSTNAWFVSGSRVTNRVQGVLVSVEFHVHDVATGSLMFRKRYTAFEEDRFSLSSVPLIHTLNVRKAIVEGLVADISQAVVSPAILKPSEYRVNRLSLPASAPLVIVDRQSLARFVTIAVTLEAIERTDRFTRFELRLHNQNSSDRAIVAVRTTKLGVMAFAKSISGQVFIVPENSKRPDRLELRAGEAGTLTITLQNDLGLMGEVALYVDVDVQSGRARENLRITFPNVQVR